MDELDSTRRGGLEQPLSNVTLKGVPLKNPGRHARLLERNRFKSLMRALDETERRFVFHALQTGDYATAAKRFGHSTPVNLLARKSVREIITLAAPFSPFAPSLLKPFVLEALARKALKGDSQAARTLLSLKSETRAAGQPQY